MHVLSWREVDFAGVVLAGLVAGYFLAIAGIWAGSVPGLVAVDFADLGRRYMGSDRPSAWLFGLASHLANSVLLVLFWAMVIDPNLAWPRILEGIGWGLVVGLLIGGALVAPLIGLGLMGLKTGDFRFALTALLLNGFWGGLIGALYVPR